MAKIKFVSPTLFIALLLILFLFFIPAITSESYYLHVLVLVGYSSVAALGVRMMLSVGQWDFGQAAILGVGAYTSGILVQREHFNFWLAFPIAGVATALGALLIGWPILRIKGAYYAILTLTLGIFIHQVIVAARGWTGGSVGLPYIPTFSPIHLFGLTVEFLGRAQSYYFALLLLLATVAVMFAVEKSRIAMVFRAIRQKDFLAESVGINITKYKVIAFVIASFFCGLAGAFSAHYFRVATPDAYGMWPSIYYVAYAIIGGAGIIFGPILGAFALIIIAEALRSLNEYQAVIYAGLLITVILFLPGGFVSLPRVIVGWVRQLLRVRGKKIALPALGKAIIPGPK